MLPHHHQFSELFAQLGLPSAKAEIEAFLRDHAPLDSAIRLDQAPFWTPAQATLLREAVVRDADWAQVVDQLNLVLRAPV